MDFTPDCVVTKKNRGNIGTPISENKITSMDNQQDHRDEMPTERFCFTPLIILPQSYPHDGLRGEKFINDISPPRQLQFL